METVWPEHGGEAGRRIREYPWAETTLGAAEGWPQSLRSVVDVALGLERPMAILWGEDLVQIPNTALLEDIGGSEIELGRSALLAWPIGWLGDRDNVRRVRGGACLKLDSRPNHPALNLSPIRDESGAVAGVLVTASGNGYAAGTPATVAELQHRSRNMLAAVRSIVTRSAQTSRDLEEFTMHVEGRIDAFGRAQAAAAWQTGGLDLAALIAEELRIGALQSGERIVLDGPDIAIIPGLGGVLALTFHELAMNSVKYGALSVPDGSITVRWEVEVQEGKPALVLTWLESGVFPPPQMMKEGFGMEVFTRTLPYDIGAETEFELQPAGMRFKLRADLDRVAVAARST